MNYTENLTLGLPEYGESADVAALNRNSGILDAYVYNTRQMECEPYDSTKTYMSGDLAIHNEVIYECNTDNTTGTWDDSKWDSTTLAEQIAKAKQMGGESALADLEDVEITNPSTRQALLFDDSDDKWKNQNLPDVSVTKTATGNPIELTDAASAPMVKCVTQITGYQSGTGTPSPDNIRPIVAYTEGEIEVSSGADVYSTDGLTGYQSNSKVEIISDKAVRCYTTQAGTYMSANQPISAFSLTIGKTYTLECDVTVTSGVGALAIRNSSYNAIVITDNITQSGHYKLTFEMPSNAYFIAFFSTMNTSVNGDVTYSHIRLYEGTERTTHTATFSNSIYQGNADFIGSKATTNNKFMQFNGDVSENWVMTSGDNYYQFYIVDADCLSDSRMLCNMFELITTSERSSKSGLVYNNDTYFRISLLSSQGISTVEQWKAFLSNNPLQIVAYRSSEYSETITPTNLPIKSLSGYNHIESSTGDMEIEYITEGYQPLVYLIQSSKHVYSTQEQIVGTWIDGRPIYERTLSGTFSSTDSMVGYLYTGYFDISTIGTVDIVLVDSSKSYITKNGVNRGFVGGYAEAERNRLLMITYYQQSSVTAYITIQYIKPITTRSLNAPLTSQKAQIEPLTDKTEETPTEEEKAVNEEENNDER